MSEIQRDIIVALSKLDRPSEKTKPNIREYVCLGHFDYAVIKDIDSGSRSAYFCGFNKSAYEGSGDYEKIIRRSVNPEGLQQNYLIYSGRTLGTIINDPHFTFMMTISVRRSEKYDTLEKCIEFFSSQKYTDNEDLNKSFCWRFYYPVARGDIILMLDSNDFAEATHALYDFVHDNEIIIYSFTIPMISSLWIQSTMEHSNCESNCCSLKLRATVKNYEKLYKLINEIGISDTLSFLASFGTDDVIVDFGQFSEEKLYKYLCYILTSDGQKALKEAVFSSELDVPRRVNDNGESVK